MIEVLNYIHANIKSRMQLKETAARFGYSEHYFCRRFAEYAGMTFTEYIRTTRIQLAAQDILDGRKITDTAFEYGYDTVSGFNKAFLRFFGCMPKEYAHKVEQSKQYYERRKAMMFKLTPRVSLLREDTVNHNNRGREYRAQPLVYFHLGMFESIARNESLDEICMSGIERILRSFTPVILPHELIVGFNFDDEGKYDDFYEPDGDEEGLRIMRENHISEEDIAAYLKINRMDKHRYLFTDAEGLYGDMRDKTPVQKQLTEEWAGMGRCIGSNHSVIGYEYVLQSGFAGILEDIRFHKERNGDNDCYRSMERLCLAAMTIGEKYADAARRLLTKGSPDYDKSDLETIIATCERVPKYPARTLLEAIQSLWFAHIINTWEDRINANSLGHLDKILYPYYRHDIDSGLLTKEQAFELICLLWLKLYRDYDVQQSCIGADIGRGIPAVNELSYLMLDATEELDFIRCLSVRFSAKTEKAFLRRALEVVGHVQKGIPFFFNDDVIIPALEHTGISREDARTYTELGCVETVIPGLSNPHPISGQTNLLKALEYTLENGRSMCDPSLAPGIDTGAIDGFAKFDDLYAAVKKQISHILTQTALQIKDAAFFHPKPKAVKSMLTKGCIITGKDYNDFGAEYDFFQVMLGGIPNLADSLAVIRKFVYEKHEYTLTELVEILRDDFPDEAVRLDFLNHSPKFGNDIAEVDALAADITSYACDVLEALSTDLNMSFHAQPFTFLWLVEEGLHCAASPDGRRKGEGIAYSVSPMQGRDFNGLTAVFNSISSLPTTRTPGTTSAIVEVDPKLFTDSNIDAITDILIAAGKKGLSNVQFNVIDADTLTDAKQHPEKYQGLAVRVSGFSQKFALLTPAMQDHIIGRTKHKCL